MKKLDNRESEEKLVEELLQGSDGALKKFYRLYTPKLERFIATKISIREDVEEVLQDTVLSALDSLVLFSGRSKLMTWLYSIARHEVADYYRRRRIKAIVFSKIPRIERFISKALAPTAKLMRKEYEREVKKVLEKLLPDHREVLELKYMDELSVKEVAEKTGMSFKACESMLSRARRAFAVLYEEG